MELAAHGMIFTKFGVQKQHPNRLYMRLKGAIGKNTGDSQIESTKKVREMMDFA
jgi:hypothetical protein